MSKKLYISLAPLFAIAAFAVMPVAAQAATQHWYKDGNSMTPGEQTPIVTWGNETNLNQSHTVSNPYLGEVNCKTVGGGTVDNPGGGGAGQGSLNALAFYECKGPRCEAEVMATEGVQGREFVEARNMPASIDGHPERGMVPWPMRLEESTVGGVSSIRLKIGEPFATFQTPSPPGMIRIVDGCEIAATEHVLEEAAFEGELKPEIGAAKEGNVNGQSCGKPSSMRFNGASTGALHSSVGGEGKYENTLKYCGYSEQELITVKP